MTLAAAKQVFAHLMQVARTRTLRPLEKRTLTRARQTLRQARKPAMNAMQRITKRPGEYQESTIPMYLTSGAKKQIKNLQNQGWEFQKTIVYPSGTINHHLINNGRTAILRENGSIEMLYPVGTEVHDVLKQRSVKQGYGSEPNPARKPAMNPRTYERGRDYGQPRQTIRGIDDEPIQIYERYLRIEAVKMRKHSYGGKSTAAGQRYFHDFTTKNARIYGLPDGSLLIKAGK